MNSDKIVTRYDTYLIKISYFFKQCQNALYKKNMVQKNSYQLKPAKFSKLPFSRPCSFDIETLPTYLLSFLVFREAT